MSFSDTSRWLCLFALIGLAGCSALPGKKVPEEESPEPEVPTTVEGETAEGVTFVLIPNPIGPGEAPDAARREFSRVQQLMEAKQWDQAKGQLNLMIETYPNLSGPYVNLAIVHHTQGELEDAEKALQYAIELNANNLDAYHRLGLVYREQGKFSLAEKAYLRALSLWPHHQPSVVNLGILYDLYMGRFQEALTQYELALNIAGGEDRTLKGWVADLKRRIAGR